MLPSLHIPRCLRTPCAVRDVTLHTFVDASQEAYGTVCYTRHVYEHGSVSCCLVASRLHARQDEEKASGIDVEPSSELEQALEDICALEESQPAEVMDLKQAKAEANKLKAEEIRQKAMGSFGQTKAREGQEEPVKKKRRGGRLYSS